MTDKVIDASALSAILFVEPGADEMSERIDGCRLWAPALLEFELANVCWKKCRRRAAETTVYLAQYALRARIQIETAPIDGEAALMLALERNLTAYDASYLWLSRHLAAELVTLDIALAAAAAVS